MTFKRSSGGNVNYLFKAGFYMVGAVLWLCMVCVFFVMIHLGSLSVIFLSCSCLCSYFTIKIWSYLTCLFLLLQYSPSPSLSLSLIFSLLLFLSCSFSSLSFSYFHFPSPWPWPSPSPLPWPSLSPFPLPLSFNISLPKHTFLFLSHFSFSLIPPSILFLNTKQLKACPSFQYSHKSTFRNPIAGTTAYLERNMKKHISHMLITFACYKWSVEP